MSLTIESTTPVAYQWRRYGEDWNLQQINSVKLFSTNRSMEVRPLYAGEVMNVFDAQQRMQQIDARVAELEEQRRRLEAERAQIEGAKP